MATRMHDKAMTASTRLAPISRSAPIADAIRLLLAAGKPMPRTLMQQLARHIPALQIAHVKTGHDAINRLRDQAGIHVLLIANPLGDMSARDWCQQLAEREPVTPQLLVMGEGGERAFGIGNRDRQRGGQGKGVAV